MPRAMWPAATRAATWRPGPQPTSSTGLRARASRFSSSWGGGPCHRPTGSATISLGPVGWWMRSVASGTNPVVDAFDLLEMRFGRSGQQVGGPRFRVGDRGGQHAGTPHASRARAKRDPGTCSGHRGRVFDHVDIAQSRQSQNPVASRLGGATAARPTSPGCSSGRR